MKNELYRTNRHSCYMLEYHLVVVTKYRHPVLVGNIKDRLVNLSRILFEDDYKCTITAINTDKDHIHLMFEAPPQVQLSKLVNSFKTVTSRRLRKEFPDFLKKYYWKPLFWSDSYFVCTVSDRNHRAVEAYIKNQGR